MLGSRNRGRSALLRKRFDYWTFVIAGIVAAVVLVGLVAIPQWLSKQARLDVLRLHVGEVAQLAASVVDGDLHGRLLDPASYSDELYAQAVKPLVRLHSADPDIHYLYTMLERDGSAYFVLDTAASPDLRTDRKLEPSGYMERFEPHEKGEDDWLSRIALGQTYITPNFEEDDYGTFLSAHAPIYDSQGQYSGFVGVDFDLQYYLARESRFRSIAIGTLAAALLMSLIVGYLVALYRDAMRRRVQELYENSITDSLTGFLNRRGAMDVIKRDAERHTGAWCLILLDIDGLKLINALRGHTTGDVVVARASEAIRESMREHDRCARIGDEFIVYAPDCSIAAAQNIAERIARQISSPEMPMVDANISASIGIAMHDGAENADFARMYHDADLALSRAKAEGRNRIGLYEPATAA